LTGYPTKTRKSTELKPANSPTNPNKGKRRRSRSKREGVLAGGDDIGKPALHAEIERCRWNGESSSGNLRVKNVRR